MTTVGHGSATAMTHGHDHGWPRSATATTHGHDHGRPLFGDGHDHGHDLRGYLLEGISI